MYKQINFNNVTFLSSFSFLGYSNWNRVDLSFPSFQVKREYSKAPTLGQDATLHIMPAFKIYCDKTLEDRALTTSSFESSEKNFQRFLTERT